MRPDFSSPVMAAAGVISLWLVLCFPFAVWARRIARPDALNAIESFLLGQTCGPVGLWLVLRANRSARQRANKLATELDHRPEPEAPELIDHRTRITEGIPKPDELPGGRAFKPPPTRPTQKLGPARMDTWSPPPK